MFLRKAERNQCSHNIHTVEVRNGIETAICMLCKHISWVVPTEQGVYSYRLVQK